MKEYKQYLLRGRDSQEAVAVVEIPSKFDMTRICDNFGAVTKVSVGIYREDPTYEYQFSSSKGLSNVNMINRLELSLHSVRENHLFTQPLTMEEVSESFFETTVEFGVSVFKISSYTYGGGRTHEFEARECIIPKPRLWARFVAWFNS
jgi:hypothetical protein